MSTLLGIVAAVVLVFCLLFAGGCSCSSSSFPLWGRPVVTTAGMKSLDRPAVKALLKRLADSPPPANLKQGACCYKATMPPNRAEYICPKCGERTLYDAGKSPKTTGVPSGLPVIVEWEIPNCRREMDELRKVAGDAITFDEAAFCKKCSPKVTEPKLVLRIAFAGEPVREVTNFQSDDLRLLRNFLAGRLVTQSGNESELPLKTSLPRLQELLGVKLEDRK